MFLATGKVIANTIQSLIDAETGPHMRFAVAYWGKGAHFQLRGPTQIICDLDSGACNPAAIRAIRALPNCAVLKLSDFHAKVVLGSEGAVVSSANMSINGLGAEGGGASGTIEAGYFVPSMNSEYAKIAAWFESKWSGATEITEEDLSRAQQKWDFRNREFPTVPDVAPMMHTVAFDVDPFTLLKQTIDPPDRLRGAQRPVLATAKQVLPELDQRQLGKVVSWTCHLLLNRAGVILDHSAGNGEAQGPATDQWIVGRLGTRKRAETIEHIRALLRAIGGSPSFTAVVRGAADAVMTARPWDDTDGA